MAPQVEAELVQVGEGSWAVDGGVEEEGERCEAVVLRRWRLKPAKSRKNSFIVANRPAWRWVLSKASLCVRVKIILSPCDGGDPVCEHF